MQERALIKCDGTGTLQVQLPSFDSTSGVLSSPALEAQSLLFVVNQNRLVAPTLVLTFLASLSEAKIWGRRPREDPSRRPWRREKGPDNVVTTKAVRRKPLTVVASPGNSDSDQQCLSREPTTILYHPSGQQERLRGHPATLAELL